MTNAPRFAFSVSEDHDGPTATVITKNLVAANNIAGAAEDWRALVIGLHDDDANFIGGVSGYTHWSWLFVERLWVAESQRAKGVGRSLMERAETEARSRGRIAAWVDTFNFQAGGSTPAAATTVSPT